MQASIQMSAHANAAKVAAAGAALLVATPAFAGDAGAGEKIFNANCAACHAGGQNSVVPDHTLEKAAIEKVFCRERLSCTEFLRLQFYHSEGSFDLLRGPLPRK
jgi:hypothetical protein